MNPRFVILVIHLLSPLIARAWAYLWKGIEGWWLSLALGAYITAMLIWSDFKFTTWDLIHSPSPLTCVFCLSFSRKMFKKVSASTGLLMIDNPLNISWLEINALSGMDTFLLTIVCMCLRTYRSLNSYFYL